MLAGGVRRTIAVGPVPEMGGSGYSVRSIRAMLSGAVMFNRFGVGRRKFNGAARPRLRR